MSIDPTPPSLSVEPARREFGLATRFFMVDRLVSMRPVDSQKKIRARARFKQIYRSTSAQRKIKPHLGIARGRRIRAGLQIFRGRSLDIHAYDRIPVEKSSAQASAEPGRSAASAPAAAPMASPAEAAGPMITARAASGNDTEDVFVTPRSRKRGRKAR